MLTRLHRYVVRERSKLSVKWITVGQVVNSIPSLITDKEI